MQFESLLNNAAYLKHLSVFVPPMIELANARNTDNGRMNQNVGKDRECCFGVITNCFMKYDYLKSRVEKDKFDFDVLDQLSLPDRSHKIIDDPFQFKTVISEGVFPSVKITWASGKDNLTHARINFKPVDLLVLVMQRKSKCRIHFGRLYWIPKEVQHTVVTKIGKKNFFTIPKKKVLDSKGMPIKSSAIKLCVKDKRSITLEIPWNVNMPKNTKKPKDRAEIWKMEYEAIQQFNQLRNSLK